MKRLLTRLLSFFNTIQGKIAFYPTLLAFVGFNLAFIMAVLEENNISSTILDNFPQLMLEDGDTALSIVSVCIGGLISMMVFSFSMVMLLLSQASSNFSPRLLPGLISDKKNQIILGAYLASILYLIFILFSIEPEDKKYALPGLSILIGIILTIGCLAAFIYFVHNMSQSIQINNILDNIFEKSKKRLHEIIELEKGKEVKKFEDTDDWYSYSTNKSGYFQNISIKNVLRICESKNIKLKLTVPKGFFVLQHAHFIKSNTQLDDDTVADILSNINFARGEFVEDNYILAFKQITEIAVKAMSPGINDPGTAANAIDYLTELFAMRMLKSDNSIFSCDDSALLQLEVVTFKELLNTSMSSLRTYCKHDPVIVSKLVAMLHYLASQELACYDGYIEAVQEELQTLAVDAKASLTNKSDWKKIKSLIKGA